MRVYTYLPIMRVYTYQCQGSLDIEDVDAGVIIPGSWREEISNQLPSSNVIIT